MNYPFCRSSCIYIASYIFFISINGFWIYLITYNDRGYINFGQNHCLTGKVKKLENFPKN